MQIELHEMQIQDASAVNNLSEQLGYKLSVHQTEEQIRTIVSRKDHTAWVAISDGKIVGWIHAFQCFFIESLSFVEIGGIVVDEDYRSKGIGKKLIRQVMNWTVEQKFSKLRVRSQTKRLATQQFYRSLKFEEIKEQKVFQLDLTT